MTSEERTLVRKVMTAVRLAANPPSRPAHMPSGQPLFYDDAPAVLEGIEALRELLDRRKIAEGARNTPEHRT